MCILSIFVSHFTFPHISSEWALQQTELSTFQYLDGPPPVLRIYDPASVTSSRLEVWASSHLQLHLYMPMKQSPDCPIALYSCAYIT